MVTVLEANLPGFRMRRQSRSQQIPIALIFVLDFVQAVARSFGLLARKRPTANLRLSHALVVFIVLVQRLQIEII